MDPQVSPPQGTRKMRGCVTARGKTTSIAFGRGPAVAVETSFSPSSRRPDAPPEPGDEI